MKYRYVSPRVTTRQITSGVKPQSLDAGGNYHSNRVLLKASTNTVYVGGNLNVSATTGIQVPSGDAAPYLELWVAAPEILWVVGAGTVYVLIEEPEGVQ